MKTEPLSERNGGNKRVFQTLEKPDRSFPNIGKIQGRFSKHWKIALAALLALLGASGWAMAQSCATLADATHAPAFAWATAGDANWFAQTNYTRDGSCAAMSGDIADDQASWIETVVTGRGGITFHWKVSSEEGWDWLEFHVNGTLTNRISGEVDWQQQQYDLESGVSTLRWVYAKDGSVSEGADAGWMTDFEFFPYTGRVMMARGDLAFGKVALTSTATRVFTLRSLGDEDVLVTDIRAPAGFAAAPTSFVLPAGAMSNISVTFAPTEPIIYTGAVEVVSDAQAGVTILPVSGTGAIVADRYVWLDSPSPAAPYTNWAMAAHTLQAALDVAGEMDTVWVTNGVYDQGGAFCADVTNRAVVPTGAVLRSVNGPAVTFIKGAADLAAGTNYLGCGPAAVRGVALLGSATLQGFTVCGGHSARSGSDFADTGGGVVGMLEEVLAGQVVDCVVTGNAAMVGGGVAGVLATGCLIANNAAQQGGGAAAVALTGCRVIGNTAMIGGGLMEGLVDHCWFVGNQASLYGGGAAGVIASNCVIALNSAYIGGGVYHQLMDPEDSPGLVNCTVVGNQALGAGGVIEASAVNSVIYGNRAQLYPNWVEEEDEGFFTACCTAPMPARSNDVANITNDPRLVSFSDPHLLPDSPCLAAGTNQAWMATAVDMDGEPRLDGALVDIGADEFWANGLTDVLSVAISVPLDYTPHPPGPLRAAAPSASPVTTPGYPVTLLAVITGRCQQTLWDMGDGLRLTNLASVIHAYTNIGSFEVWLTASNLAGTASAVATVQVVDANYYVATNGSDAADGRSWATAKQTIQAAVDACRVPGGTVWVSNGVYAAGSRMFYGNLTRVVITNPVTVRSVNGHAVTIIRGEADPAVTNYPGVGSNAVRCAGLDWGATLVGFTLEQGMAYEGGGVYFSLAFGGGSSVSNCVIRDCAALGNGGGAWRGLFGHCTFLDNYAGSQGGGAYASELWHTRLVGNRANYGGGLRSGMAYNCLFTGNAAAQGGGAARSATLYNCTVAGNSALVAGGVDDGACYNTIVYFNEAAFGANWDPGSDTYLHHSCVTPPPEAGVGNFAQDPQITGFSDPHLLAGSPCRGAGVTQAWMAATTDFDGEPRRNGLAVDVGCDEFYAAGCTDVLQVAVGFPYGARAAVGGALPMLADVRGRALALVWDFGDGGGALNQARPTHAYAAGGNYNVTLSAANLKGSIAAVATARVETATWHVAPSGDDAADGLSWAAPKQTIQAAVNAAAYGGQVLVSNGVYAAGAHAYGAMVTSNRVILTNAVSLRSVNGPAVTVIAGTPADQPDAVRCLLLGPGARAAGFALTNGHTSAEGEIEHGGGAFCMDASATLSNCVVSGCEAAQNGGGVFQGTVYNSCLHSNRAIDGGGACDALLVDCLVVGNHAAWRHGGGAGGGWATRTEFVNNYAKYNGGAANSTLLSNCVLRGNAAGQQGGGLYGSTAWNCLLAGNTAVQAGGGAVDSDLLNCTLAGNSSGVRDGSMLNCVAYGNTAGNWQAADSSNYQYTCTTPLPLGAHCITSAPALDAAYRLTGASPCIDAGLNQPWMIGARDLAGTNRIIHGTVDMGAYEFTFVAGGLIAGFSGADVSLVWDAVPGATNYLVYRSTSATPPGAALAQVGIATAWLDTTAAAGTCYYYWIRAQVDGVIYDYSAPAYYCPPGPVGQHTRYVWTNSPAPQAPYTNWATAAHTLQDAADEAENGDLVLAADGIYDQGGGPYDDADLTYARLVINKDITVRSLNGPATTTIIGAPGDYTDPQNITNAYRCLVIGRGHAGAVVDGFFLAGGHTFDGTGGYSATPGDPVGGGALLLAGTLTNCFVADNRAITAGGVGFICFETGAQARLTHCVVDDNTAHYAGGIMGMGALSIQNCIVSGNRALREETGRGGRVGGVELLGFRDPETLEITVGTLRQTVIVGNFSESETDGGGGVMLDGGHVVNCTIVDNRSRAAGGGLLFVQGETNIYSLVNNIIYYNSAPLGPNYYVDGPGSLAMTACCATPAAPGVMTNAPLLAGLENPHLLPASPCIAAGDAAAVLAGETDIDGEPRLAPGNTVDIGCDQVVLTNMTGALDVAIGVAYSNVVAGAVVPLYSDVEGKALSLEWTVATNGGSFTVTNELSIAPRWSEPGTYAVVLAAANLSTAGAATVTVTVVANFTNFVSLTGAHVAPYTNWAMAATNIQTAVNACYGGGMTRVAAGRFVLDSALNVQTPIHLRGDGGWGATVLTRGNTEHALLVLNHPDALVENVMLTNGVSAYGGGALVLAGTLRSAQVTGCYATHAGGGVKLLGNAVLDECYLAGNLAQGEGGGVYANQAAIVSSCFIIGNEARGTAGEGGGGGGGAFLAGDAEIRDSMVSGNLGWTAGGVMLYDGGTARNCTILRNRAYGTAGGLFNGGGALYNNIIYYNTAQTDPNTFNSGTAVYNCSTPLISGAGNIDAAPMIMGHFNPCLVAASPCINAGSTNYVVAGQVDIYARPRVYNGQVDMGCYEYNPTNIGGAIGVAIDGEAGTLVNEPLDLYADVHGEALGFVWAIAREDGSTQQVANAYQVTLTWTNAGAYPVTLTAYNLEYTNTCTQVVQVVAAGFVNYASLQGAHIAPFTNWAMAATNIQAAVDACYAHGTVMVNTGVFMQTSELALDVPVKVQGVSPEPNATVLDADRGQRVVSITHAAAVLRDVTLRGALGNNGAGLFMTAGLASNLVITGCGHPDTTEVAGAYLQGDSVLAHSLIISNQARTIAGARLANNARMRHCRVRFNEAAGDCAGVFLEHDARVDDTEISGNLVHLGFAGGVFFDHGGMVANSRISSNAASQGVGATFNQGGLLTNSIVEFGWGFFNAAGVWMEAAGRIDHCILQSNTCAEGNGGAGLLSSGGVIVDSIIRGNRATTGGGLKLQNGGLVEDCRFEGNQAQNADTVNAAGGAGLVLNGGTFNRCKFINNSSEMSAGALHLESGGEAQNCLFYNNSAADRGGAVYLTRNPNGVQEDGKLLGCTLAGNSAVTNGGGVWFQKGGQVYNTIMYSNTAPTNANYGVDEDNAIAEVAYSCATPLWSGAGTNNIAANPLFACVCSNNYRLTSGSPCVNTGLNLGASSQDLAGNPRRIGAAEDMGAYEYPLAPSGLSAASNALDCVQLNWEFITGATGYAIYRSTTAVAPTSAIAVVGTDIRSWCDSSATPGQRYYYWLTARYPQGASALSSAAYGWLRSQALPWLMLLLE